MKAPSYSFAKDCCGAILVGVGALGLLYGFVWLLPLGVFGTYFWTGMAMPLRAEAEYQGAVHHHLWSGLLWRFFPSVLICVGLLWCGRRMRRRQRRLLRP